MIGLLLLLLWWTAAPLAGVVFTVVKLVLESRVRDPLPATAASWASQQAREQGIEVAMDRGPVGFNGFVPLTEVVVLDGPTYEGLQPFSHAVAAHEVGHVWLYQRFVLVGRVLGEARLLQVQTRKLAVALVLTAVLLGSSTCVETLRTVLTVLLVSGLLVTLDELVATARAVAMLRGHLPTWRWGSAGFGLAIALFTYVAAVAADLALWSALEPLWALLPPSPLVPDGTAVGWLGTIVLILCTVVLSWRAMLVAVGVWTRDAVVYSNGNHVASLSAALFGMISWSVASTPRSQLLLGGVVLAGLDAVVIVLVAALSVVLLPLAEGRWVRRISAWGQELAEMYGMIGVIRFRESLATRLVLALTALAWAPYVVWYWLRA